MFFNSNINCIQLLPKCMFYSLEAEDSANYMSTSICNVWCSTNNLMTAILLFDVVRSCQYRCRHFTVIFVYWVTKVTE